MKAWTRLLIVLAALLLGATFFLPLWRFELWAPQYPEGLAMQVWSWKVTGNVQTINILNHYVGMKPILAENFPEFSFFPYVLGAFLGTGILVALINRPRLAIAWSFALVLFASVALVDFYVWEYKFGHELNEDAAIKVEGMAYQPPFIGSQTLLNITAKSIPDKGGIAMSAGVSIALLVLLILTLGSKRGWGRRNALTCALLFFFA